MLFTAFEPSGDDHASAIIAELKRRYPDLTVYAWGGPKMQAAGATIIERTGDDAVMGMPGLAKIREHRKINDRIAAWLDANPVDLHVPVDSPAANFPVCRLARARGIRVIHLVAPQIWAWARWRIHKLRRLTSLVLCLLPFEERFFQKRNVPARFIGHFLFDEPLDEIAIAARAGKLPSGSPRLTLMPGSRPAELEQNFPLMLDVFAALKKENQGLSAVVVATRTAVEERLRAMAIAHCGGTGYPAGLTAIVADTDAAIRWCDVALVKSGTVTLHVTRQLKPMVIFYKKRNFPLFLAVKTILATKHFTLPNVIAARRIVPEFVPHFGGPDPITQAVRELFASEKARDAQRAELKAVCDQFRGMSARKLGADSIADALSLKPAESAPQRSTPAPVS